MKKEFQQRFVNGAVFFARMVVLICLVASQFFGTAQSVSALDEPFIIVQPDHGWVGGVDWTAGNTLTITVDIDTNIGNGYLYQDNSQTVAGDSSFHFNLEPAIDLVPGQYVTVSDTVSTKSTQITEVHFDTVNVGTDVATGRGPASQPANVFVSSNTGEAHLDIMIGSDGNWTADFASLLDIQTILDANIWLADPDGDGTLAHLSIPNFSARFPEKEVHGYGWTLGGPDVTISIDDPDYGTAEDYTATLPVIEAPWNASQTFVQFTLDGFELEPGQLISMTDGDIVKTHTVSSLSISEIDVDMDTLTGTVESGSTVEVDANCGDSGCAAFQRVTASGTNWTADFSLESGGDIQPGSRGEARAPDEDGDTTTVQWYVPNPYIMVAPYSNWINARDWAMGVEVTMTIDDPSNGVSVDYTDTQTVEHNPFNPGDPNDFGAFFDWPESMDQGPNYIISMDGDGSSKTYTVADQRVTSIDIDTDQIFGVASKGANIQVCVNLPGNCIPRYLTADIDDGKWTADYSIAGSEDDEKVYDLQPGDNGWSSENGDEGDKTWYDWRVANPYIEVAPYSNWIHARDWAMGVEVTMTIDDPLTVESEDYTETQTVVQAPWNPDDPNDFGAFFEWPDSLTPGPNFIITMEGDGQSKTYTVADQHVTSIDIDTDQIFGVASKGANIQVCVNLPGHCIPRYLTADSDDGTWTADYSEVYDLQPGDNGWSSENGDEGDKTWYDWNIPNPRFTVQPDHGWVQGNEWTAGNTVTLIVDDTAVPSLPYLYSDSNTVEGDSSFNFDVAPAIFDLVPGQYVTVSDTVTTKSTQIAEVHFDSVDEGADTAAGRGPNNASASVYIRTATPDEDEGLDITISAAGTWTADFSPFDIQNIQDANVQAYDDDGDGTMAHLQTAYLLTVSKAGTGSGTVTSDLTGISCGADCSQSYNENTKVTLTATPATGSTFSGWSGGACSGTGSCVVTMTAAKSVTATFTLKTYVLTVSKAGAGSGTVTSSPAGINCGTHCNQSYNYKTKVTLTATPAAGSAFTGWSGACTNKTGSCVVTMTAAKSVTATFVKTYLLKVSKAGVGSGTVTSSPAGITCGTDCTQSYNYNTKVTLTAKPASGSAFTGWSGACTGTGSCVVTMTAAKSVTATFGKGYLLTVSKAGNGSGTVTSSPAGITCGTDCSQSYAINTKVTLTAKPATGSTFTGWSGACTGTGSCVVTMSAVKSVKATFTLKTYILTVSKAGTGSGTVTSSPAGISCGTDCSQSYNYNTKVTLTAKPATGSTFTGWSGACTGTGSCVVTMTAAKSVKATFTKP